MFTFANKFSVAISIIGSKSQIIKIDNEENKNPRKLKYNGYFTPQCTLKIELNQFYLFSIVLFFIYFWQ